MENNTWKGFISTLSKRQRIVLTWWLRMAVCREEGEAKGFASWMLKVLEKNK